MSATEATSTLQRSRLTGEDADASPLAPVRFLIWVYFLLLLFEGAMRKWWFPGLSQGLLVVRDPVVLGIYFLAFTRGIFPSQNKYIQILFYWTIVAVAFSFVLNKAHPLTISYGARTNLLHFPLIFIIGSVMTRRDLIYFGWAFLLLSWPMTWVVAEQFQADREDIMNVAAGGFGYQLETSGGRVRASGTFSFIRGIVFYYCFVMAFVIYGFLRKGVFPNWLLYLGAGATFLAMVTAGSRAVIAETLQVLACFAFLAYFRPSEFGRITASVFGLSAIGLALYSQIELFKEGFDFLSLRFEEAANVEGNPIEAYFNRYWEILSAPYYYSLWTETFGLGLGTATRAGTALGAGMGVAEVSWSRPIIENGPLLGFLFVAWRIWLVKGMLKISILAIKRGSYLAIFLFGAAGPIILFGLLGQPTNLGFAAFGGGLCVAAARMPKI